MQERHHEIVKMKGTAIKDRKGSGHVIKKKMVEMEMAVCDVAKPHGRKLRTNKRGGG